MQTIVRSPWATEFEELVRIARSSLVVSSPYVSGEACRRLVDSLGDRVGDVHLLLVTDLSRDQLLRGANDAGAISDLASHVRQTEVRFLPSLHAKTYVADEEVAIVTSANMTGAGLLRNVEYGVRFSEPSMVRTIRQDVCAYAQLGTLLTRERLRELATLAGRLRKV